MRAQPQICNDQQADVGSTDHEKPGPAMTNPKPLAWVVLIIPLKALAPPTAAWTAGAWHVTEGPEAVDRDDRIRRYHVTEAIRTVTDAESRAWLAEDHELSPNLRSRCVETVEVVVGRKRQKYLLWHLDLMRGPLGGVSDGISELARLVRLRSVGVHGKLFDLLGDRTCEIDTSFMRATSLVGIPAADALDEPPRVEDQDPCKAWLVAMTDLPSRREARYTADPRELFKVVPGVRGVVGAGGLAVVGEGGTHLRERTFRAHYCDALLIAVIQRDVLLQLAADLAASRSPHSWATRRALRSFDEFRSSWWKPAAVDHPVSSVVGSRWRDEVGVDRLMEHSTHEVTDLYAARRTRMSELLGSVAIIVAALAVVLQAL